MLCKYFHSVAHIEDEIRCQDIPQADATVDGKCFIHAHIVSVCVLLIKCVYLKGSYKITFYMMKNLICYHHHGINNTTHVFNIGSNV